MSSGEESAYPIGNVLLARIFELSLELSEGQRWYSAELDRVLNLTLELADQLRQLDRRLYDRGMPG